MIAKADEVPRVASVERSRFQGAFWKELRRSRNLQIGVFLVALVLVTAVAAPVIAPQDPNAASLRDSRQGPSASHWLGTDQLGRDILSRLVYGSRIALMVGTLTVAFAAGVGIPVGLLSGFFGGMTDRVSIVIIDVLLAFPNILLAIAIIGALGPNLRNATIAIGIAYVPIYARLTRGSVLSIREMTYTTAATAVGSSNLRVMFRHILPNALSPLIVYSTLTVGRAILAEAGLSFLGLGAQPPTPSWGLMASTGRDYLLTNAHIATIPSLAILATVLGFNLLGDGLRDALDPRTRQR